MAYISDSIISEAVDTIISSRDFCGNEKSAVLEFAAEAGFKGADALKIYGIANFRANKAWNGYKKAAGVSPKYRLGGV